MKNLCIQPFPHAFSVCKVDTLNNIDISQPFFFTAVTDEEISLVCPTAQAPACTAAREDGWRALRVQGVLDFSLIGILAGITAALAEAGISIFAVSTYNTDYILLKEEHFDRALRLLAAKGCSII